MRFMLEQPAARTPICQRKPERDRVAIMASPILEREIKIRIRRLRNVDRVLRELRSGGR